MLSRTRGTITIILKSYTPVTRARFPAVNGKHNSPRAANTSSRNVARRTMGKVLTTVTCSSTG